MLDEEQNVLGDASRVSWGLDLLIIRDTATIIESVGFKAGETSCKCAHGTHTRAPRPLLYLPASPSLESL